MESAPIYIRGAHPLRYAKSRVPRGGKFSQPIGEIAVITAISNYLKLVVWIAISKFKFSLQPNYSQWGVN